MKTIKILTVAFAAIAIVSCSKDIAPIEKGINNEASHVQFTALANETRTSLTSDDDVIWTTGDLISVFSGTTNNQFSLTSINPDGSGVFEGELVEADTYYAVYPYSEETTISSTGVITASIPSVQKPVAEGFANGTNLSVAVTQSTSFMLKNVGALMEINIQTTGVKAVTIAAKGSQYITGKLSITLDGSGVPSYTVVSGSKTVTLLPAQGETFAVGNYYAVVLPQTYTGGVKVIYTTSEEQSATVSASSDIEVSRSQIKNFGCVETSMEMLDVINLVDPEGEGKTETANCYIPSSAGRRYSFPATVMGNGATTPEDKGYIINTIITSNANAPAIVPETMAPKSAKLLWQTAQSMITDVTLIDGKVYFTTKGTTTDDLTAGNAVIAVFSGDNCTGDILWSWHMWVTDADLNANVQTWKIKSDYQDYTSFADPVMMDRNLGALTEKCFAETNNNLSHGLYYQWGRKDPFVGAGDAAKNTTVARVTYNDCDAVIPVATAATKPLTQDGKWRITQAGADPMHAPGSDNCNWAKYPMTFVQVGSGYWVESRYNLWGCAPHQPSENYNGSKTIMDPCPAGYRVCNQYAFTNIVPDALSGKWADVTVSNLLSTTGTTGSCRNGGFQIKYDGVAGHTTWLPSAGEICNCQTGAKASNNGKIWRTGDYCRYWTNTIATTASAYAGFTFACDYNNFLNGSEKAGYGRSIRCEKIK